MVGTGNDCPTGNPKDKFWELCQKIEKGQLKNTLKENLLYLILLIFLQGFVQDCSFSEHSLENNY